ncbi:uncharacterized protein LOC133861071 [Alnus glutinosa]|uniref:uncharacterized protein LOC133861071 n=1 Tax=Alnus glutinosa TaxID=3517 RepID=UPI002D796FD9|nr:uncharacterized protein LOC133861071 [Alnus glutinosa]
MSHNLLIHKPWESLDQLRDTLTQSKENTHRMVEYSRLMMSKWNQVTEIIQDLVQEEAVHVHPQNANPAPTLFEPFDDPPQSGVLRDAVDDSIPATKFEPMDEPSVPAVTEPNKVVQLWRVDSWTMNKPSLLSKIDSLDAQLVPEVMKQNVEKPFPPLVVFDNNVQLSLADISVELQLVARKHRWRWKPVNDDENATANNSAGAVDGTHRAPKVFSSFGCYVSLHTDKVATSLDAPRCTNDCYVAVDYLRHLNNHTYVAFATAKVHFLKIGPSLFQEWPQLLETQRSTPSQLWRYLVFQHSTKTAKHRWRWKLPGWRTSWVPITGSTDLQHLLWKRTEPNAQIGGMKSEGVELSVLLAETQRRWAVEPDHVPDWRELILFRGLAVSAAWETLFCLNTPKLNPTVGIVLFLNISAGLLGFFFIQSRRASGPRLGFHLIPSPTLPFTCPKGIDCAYPPSELARLNPRVCWYWLSGDCFTPTWVFQHPPLDRHAGTTPVSFLCSTHLTIPTTTRHMPAVRLGQHQSNPI